VTLRSEVLSNRDHGLNVKPEMMTTGEWLSSWLARRLREGHITGVTHARYEIAIRVHLNASVGSIGLQELRRDHVADMTGNWTTGQDGHRAQSPASVKKNLGVLRHALDDAVAADLIVRNPAAHVSAPPVPSVEEKRALTQPEIRSLLRAANATRYEVPIASLSPRGSDAGNSSLCVGPTLI
jgi:site-specific recombinase XerC